MNLRTAIIGCGKIGSEFVDGAGAAGIYSHAGAYAACPTTSLVAVCDTDPATMRRCADRWGVTAGYTDARRLLAEQQPDIVSVCTPDQTHFELIRLAIESPGVRGVLAEKPLALECDQGVELVRIARDRRVILAVNYSRRYAANHVELRERIRSGKFGDIQSVGGFYTKGTLHNGTHWFDLARFLVGEVIEAWGLDMRGEGGADPTLDAVLRFESGASAHLQACDARAFSVFEMDLVGTRGRARILDSGHRVDIQRVVESHHYPGYQTLADDAQMQSGMRDVLLHAVEDLVRCLKEGGQPRCSGEDGLAALRIALAVRESARTGAFACCSSRS